MNGRKKNARKKVSPEHKDRKHLKLTQNSTKQVSRCTQHFEKS